MLHIFIHYFFVKSYLLRLATDDLYLTSYYDVMPRVSTVDFAEDYTFGGIDSKDGSMVLIKDENYALTVDNKTEYLNYTNLQRNNVPPSQIFYIVIDPGTGFYRLRNGKKCVEWFESGNFLKMTECFPIETQLFRIVDIGI